MTKNPYSILLLLLIMLKGSTSEEFTFGNHTIKEFMHETCNYYEYKDIYKEKTKFNQQEEKMRESFGYGEIYMKRFEKDGSRDHIDDLASHAVRFMYFHIILTVLTVIFMCFVCWCLIFRGIKRGIHRCTKKRLKDDIQKSGVNKKNKSRSLDYTDNKCLLCLNTRRSRFCLYCCNIIFGVILILMLMGWNFDATEAVEKMRKSDCAISMLYSSAINGHVFGYFDSREIYLGISGYINLYETFKTEIKNVKPYTTNIYSLSTANDQFSVNLDKIYKEFANKTIQSAINSTKDYSPNFIKYLNRTKNLDKETLTSKSRLNIAIGNVNQYLESTDYVIKRTHETMVKSMGKVVNLMEELDLGLNYLKADYIEPYEYNSRGKYLETITNSIPAFFIILTVLYLIAFTCSYKVRKAVKLSVCFQSFYAIIILYMAVIVLSYSIGSYMISAVSYNICTRASQIIDKEELIKDLVPESIYKFSKSCFSVKNADGFFVNDVADDVTKDYQVIKSILTTSSINLKFFGYNETSDKFQLFNSFQNLKLVYDQLKKFNNSEHFNKETEVYEQVDKINEVIKCEKNEFRLSEAECKIETKSKVNDPEMYKVGEDYCMVSYLIGYSTFSERYKAPSCAANSIPLYQNLESFRKEYIDLIDEVISKIDTDLIPSTDNINNELKILKNVVESAQDSFPNTRNFFKNSTFEEMGDCRTLNKLLVNAIGTVCFEVFPPFWEQTKTALLIGPLLVLFGCFNFCGVLGSRVKLIEKDTYGHGAIRQGPKKDDLERAPIGLGSQKTVSNRRNNHFEESIQNINNRRDNGNGFDNLDGFSDDFENTGDKRLERHLGGGMNYDGDRLPPLGGRKKNNGL